MKKALTKEQMTEELKKDFLYVYEWADKPNTVYPEHSHKGKVSFFVLNGNILAVVDGVHMTIRKGQRFDVLPGVLHSGRAGIEGCVLLVGKEIKGDA